MEIKQAVKWLNNIPQRILFAQKVAINRTAKLAQAAVRAEMPRVFDRPTKFALNSTYVLYGNKEARAVIGIRGYAFKVRGNAGGYMRAQVYGEDRPLKGSEFRLRDAGILPSDRYTVPGSGAKLDSYGNMNRGQITAVLSKLGLIREAQKSQDGGRRAGRRNSRYAKAEYFAGGKKSLAPGIWQRVAGGVKPILVFIRKPKYLKRLEFDVIVRNTFDSEFPSIRAAVMNSVLRRE